MAVQELNDTLVNHEIILPKSGWDRRLARWISHIGSPPVLLMGTVMAASAAAGGVWEDTAVYLTFTLAMPIAFIAYLVWRGKAVDFDVSVRQQRVIPMFVALAGSAAGWLYFIAVSVPHLLLVLGTANLLIALFTAGITLFWKISIHSATSSAAAVLAWALFGTPVFFLVVPLIVWSRVRLQRHTLSQAIAGSLLGSIVLGTVFLVLGL